MKYTGNKIISLALGLWLGLPMVGCGRRTPNDLNLLSRGKQKTDLSQFDTQSTVPGEYIIKRTGSAYLESPEAFGAQYGMKFISTIDSLDMELFQVSDPSQAQQLQVSGAVAFVEPNTIRRLNLPTQPTVQTQASPLQSQNVRTWSLNPGRRNVYIGLIDTGVDTSHPDLKEKLLPGQNTLDIAQDIGDEHGHGTLLAGLAVAANREQQAVGVAPESRIIPVKALDKNGVGTDFSIAAGIAWAVEHGAKVVVSSAMGNQPSKTLKAAIQFSNSRGVPVVVPSGSQGASYPSADQGVIAIGATDAMGQQVAGFSGQGPWVVLSAPGQSLRSTAPIYPVAMSKNGLSTQYGTLNSAGGAAMQVAAAIALLRSTQPNLTLFDIKNRLMQSADDVGPRGFDPLFGSGRLNTYRMLTLTSSQMNQQSYNSYSVRYPRPF